MYFGDKCGVSFINYITKSDLYYIYGGDILTSDSEKNTVALPHCISMEDRSKLFITGVRDVDSFDEETVTVVTSEGELAVKGSGLHIGKLSTDTGEMTVEGRIDALVYSDEVQKQGGFFGRVFR